MTNEAILDLMIDLKRCKGWDYLQGIMKERYESLLDAYVGKPNEATAKYSDSEILRMQIWLLKDLIETPDRLIDTVKFKIERKESFESEDYNIFS